MTKKSFRSKAIQNSVQTRLSLILILTATSILAVFASFNYITAKSDMIAELSDLSDFWAKHLSKTLVVPLWNYDDESAEAIVISTMIEKQIYAIDVRDIKNDILCGRTRDHNWNPVEIDKKISGDYYVRTEDILIGSEKIGTVEVFLSPQFMYKKLKDSAANMLITVIILNISLVFSFFIGIRKSIILPVTRIVENVRIIASGQLDREVYSERKDEIGQLASDVEIMRRAVKDLTDNLEAKVQDRTKQLQERSFQLQESMENLKKAQHQLVQSEKMAALGGLVAGVAHEINTPVGIGVTEASFLEEKTRIFSEAYTSGDLKRSDFEKYIRSATGASASILANLERAAELIASFKQVAVDQSSDKQRRFLLKAYISEILLSLRPKYKKTSHTITVNCPESLEINSFPGAFSQVITNFVTNSLVHGFEEIEKGEMVFDVSAEGDELLFRYSDNGRGMNDECLRQIFNPFFTTKRTRGGTGLGMHIVYNLVTQTLGGQLECKSSPGEGTVFLIKMKIGDQNPEPEI